MRDIPELLAPAGSYEALLAAIDAGADAVYLGGSFNARAFARNFDRESIRDAIALCHSYGVSVYVTLNTLVFEREMKEWLEYADYLWSVGADAFIVADLGAAMALKKYIPSVRLHASTQMSVHNSEGVRLLSELGFERVVVARELSREDLASIIKNTDTEIEMFVHGALCVSSSGQCLMSSLVGDRSGNRGECAQPCRMNYNGAPVLSLKDNCLAEHITEIIDMGAASLKIEGRMKTPEYVHAAVRIYRELLDSKRNATKGEMRELERVFSRSGFTDGYFVSKKDGMCGVRTDSDKKKSEGVAEFGGLERKVPVNMRVSIKAGEPMRLTLGTERGEVSLEGAAPMPAQNAPIDKETVKRCLTKLGGTAYECKSIDIELDSGVYVRVSELNALRRDAVSALEAVSASKQRENFRACSVEEAIAKNTTEDYTPYGSSARFLSAAQLSVSRVGAEDFDRIYLPLSDFSGKDCANGVICPPLVYDGEWEGFISALEKAREQGGRYAVCSNISQIKPAKAMGFTVTADFRLNAVNPKSAEVLSALGADEIILSPELKLGGIRDIHENKSVIVYGKIPVMITEKCVIGECGGCKSCKHGFPFYLRDRTGAEFAAFGLDGHRSIIYNSVPTYMADAQSRLSSIGAYSPHFIFSDEDGDGVREIILAYKKHTPYKGKYRRL